MLRENRIGSSAGSELGTNGTGSTATVPHISRDRLAATLPGRCTESAAVALCPALPPAPHPFFTISGRMNRLQYLTAILILPMFVIVPAAVAAALLAGDQGVIVLGPTLLAMIGIHLWAGARRFHDLGYPGTWILLYPVLLFFGFVPLLIGYLLLKSGKPSGTTVWG